MSEFDWLDTEPAAASKKPAKRRKRRKARAAVKKPSKKPVRPAAPVEPVKVESTSKIDCDTLRGKAMFAAVKGRKRTFACDGKYLFFRPKNCIAVVDGTTVKHAFLDRLKGYISSGELVHVETQDDVEIYEVQPHSSMYRECVYLGAMSDGDIQARVVQAACKMDWALYTDALEELAGRVKGAWQTEGQGRLAWNERLAYVGHLIASRGGPAPAHIAAGMQKVRQQRGVGKGRVILMPPR